MVRALVVSAFNQSRSFSRHLKKGGPSTTQYFEEIPAASKQCHWETSQSKFSCISVISVSPAEALRWNLFQLPFSAVTCILSMEEAVLSHIFQTFIWLSDNFFETLNILGQGISTCFLSKGLKLGIT